MKKKILVLGATGMLGSAVYNHFKKNPNFITIPTYRTQFDPTSNGIYFDALTDSVETIPKNFDYILNCIGIITPFIDINPVVSLKINSLFPLELARYCDSNNMRLIHITTDCVYSGKDGKYVENSPQDATDFYGKSKSLGECFSNGMVLRTSIVGQETHNFVSLFSWAKSQAGKRIEGYDTHLWNGLTTKWYAKICEKIILEDLYETDLFHVFAADDVSKFQLLQYFNDIFSLKLEITKAYPEKIDRTLRTTKTLCSKLEIPTVKEMIIDMNKE
ncbi:sugar nucleotide-binding protein [Anaerotignum sp.]|uniref:sugar nucleotide-binding protein n=1 Tax=Anaerotignum sp. TaxID=2039241 RepID=UPI0028A00575|nr:sugar nucleotide-binding protein [Anaerotignum sp.]